MIVCVYALIRLNFQAVCKKCGKEIQGLVTRTKQDCNSWADASAVNASAIPVAPKCYSRTRLTVLSTVPSPLNNFVVQTSASEDIVIDIQYPFSIVTLLIISMSLTDFNEVYESLQSEFSDRLQGQNMLFTLQMEECL